MGYLYQTSSRPFKTTLVSARTSHFCICNGSLGAEKFVASQITHIPTSWVWPFSPSAKQCMPSICELAPS